MFCNQSWKAIGFVVAIATCAGCKPQPVGETIQGIVSIDGEPMNEGLITFQPIEKTKGPKISTVIENGKYEIASEDGLCAGVFRIEILGIPPGVKAMAEGKSGDAVLPHPAHSQSPNANARYREVASEFNFQSQLRVTVQAGIKNRQDFQVDYVSARSFEQ